MKVKDLIQQLSEYADLDTFVYINYEKNWEDEFRVVEADTGNLLFVPKSLYLELKDSQEFTFVKG